MKTKNGRTKVFFSLLIALSVAMLACSADSKNGVTAGLGGSGFNTNTTPTAGTGIAGSTAGTGGSGVTTNVGGAGGSAATPPPIGAGGTATTIDEDEKCAGKKIEPQQVEIQVPVEVPYTIITPKPIAIYIMLDRSGSMSGSVDPEDQTSATKWETVVDAVNTFLNDPESAHLDVGLQYFPLPGTGDEFTGGQPAVCDGTGYDTPAVAVGTLPDNAAAISDSLATGLSESPTTLTPMQSALIGISSFCSQFQTQNPEERCVGVLISDGEPTTCETDANALITIADNAYNNSNVKTFTVGMTGAKFDLLDDIGEWGGTDCTPKDTSDGFACDVSSGMTLVQAFEVIREVITTVETKTETRTEYQLQLADCEFELPETPELVDGQGQEFDKGKANVILSEPNKPDQKIGMVAPGSSCGSAGGWHYDDYDAPTKIMLCDETCAYIKSKVNASIDIQLGCQTVVILN